MHDTVDWEKNQMVPTVCCYSAFEEIHGDLIGENDGGPRLLFCDACSPASRPFNEAISLMMSY